jgi:hypothetical protein
MDAGLLMAHLYLIAVDQLPVYKCCNMLNIRVLTSAEYYVVSMRLECATTRNRVRTHQVLNSPYTVRVPMYMFQSLDNRHVTWSSSEWTTETHHWLAFPFICNNCYLQSAASRLVNSSPRFSHVIFCVNFIGSGPRADRL